MIRTAVVGGGPAGLAAAYRLVQQPEHTVLVLEQAPIFGGLAAGFRHDDYTLDFGPHRLHAADGEVLTDLRSLLGDELELRPRLGRVRLSGQYLPYPIGPASLFRLGLRRLMGLSAGAIAARIARPPLPPASYEEVLRARLGKPLYRLFYGPYAEKVWGLPGNEISPYQAERRVNQHGPADLVRLAIGRGPGRHYLYPRGGFGRIPAAYVQALQSMPAAQLECSASIDAVEWRPGRIEALRYAREGPAARVCADQVVWTAPVTELVRRLEPPAPPEVQQAIGRLRYRAIVLCYLALATPRVGKADTYYFPERRFPFNRVTEQKNFSAAMVPPDRTVLGMDLACDAGSTLFRSTDEALRDLVLPALVEAGLVRQEKVIEVFSRRFPQAYPVYDLGYHVALRKTMDWLMGFDNLWLIGRQGLFLHNNTHHSLLMGYQTADAIGGGNRTNWPAALAQFATFRVVD